MRRIVFEPGPAKQDAGSLQNLSLRSVFTAIASNPNATAAECGRATGLSASTVSRLVEELLERNLILEGDRVRGKRGQPGISLRMNPNGAYSAGCQIGFGNCYIFVRSLGGEILAEREFTIARCAYSHVADAVIEAFQHVMDAAPIGAENLTGLGVAAPCDFDILCETVMGKHGEGWDERAFRQEVELRLSVPVTTYTLGAAGAWAELAANLPPRPADYLYLFVDRFIQSGLLLDGRLWVPPHHGSGSIGRAEIVMGHKRQRLYDLVGCHALLQRMAGGGASQVENTAQWLEQSGLALARAVQGFTDTIGLPLVIVDGVLAPELLEALSDELSLQLVASSWSSAPLVKRGRAGPQAPARGAALRPLYTTFFAVESE